MPKTRAPRPSRPPRGTRVAVVVARWNAEITDALAEGALAAAREAGAAVDRFDVAGSFELPAAVAMLADTGRYDAIVPIGCLVRGATPHFEFLAHAVAIGLMELSLSYPVAVPFGVLTCDTLAQARARAGGRRGNKGTQAMDAALALVALRRSFARGRAARGPAPSKLGPSPSRAGQPMASSQRRSARRAATAPSRSTS